ncbi:MAG: hypothetical protein R3Y54_01425 [Eubacteriales bacterium]
MTITPINLNATITRTPDFLQVKQNEEQKPAIDQTNIQQHMEKDVELKQSQVRKADDADNHLKKFDAREKGNGTYYNQDKEQKRKKEQEDEKKAPIAMSAFDIKI